MLPADTVVVASGIHIDPVLSSGARFRPMPAAVACVMHPFAEAVTIGGLVLIDPSRWDDVASGRRPALVAHEIRHVEQWRQDGPAFLVRYLLEYLAHRIAGLPHGAAYAAISYEADARRYSAHVTGSPV